MFDLIRQLLIESTADSRRLQELLEFVRDRVVLVGSRGRGDHRPDSDFDLHIVDMMETDETFEDICKWLTSNNVHYLQDKFGSGSITIPPQVGFPVSVEFGFWEGTPLITKISNYYGVCLRSA